MIDLMDVPLDSSCRCRHPDNSGPWAGLGNKTDWYERISQGYKTGPFTDP
jgi:hypothetical protein